MQLFEWIGDEVLYPFLVALLLIFLVLAWISTRIHPLHSILLVQMQTWPRRRIVQIIQVEERDADRIEQESTTTSEIWHRIPVESIENVYENADNSTDISERFELEIQEINPISPSDNLEGQENSEREISTTSTTAITTTNGDRDGTDGPQGQQGDTRIKLKFLDDTHKLVAAWLTQSVGEFKRQHFNPALASGQVVRLIYRGQLLRDDDRSLASYGLHDNCVLHCHVSSLPYRHETEAANSSPQTRTNNVDENEDVLAGNVHLGRYIYVLFAVKFATLWLGFGIYPEYFDFASFFSLVMCTLIYVLFIYANVRTHRLANRNRNDNGNVNRSIN